MIPGGTRTMAQVNLEGLSLDEQRGIYRLFASAYLSLPSDSDEGRKALSILGELQVIFKLDSATANEWLLECARTRELIIEFIDGVTAKAA